MEYSQTVVELGDIIARLNRNEASGLAQYLDVKHGIKAPEQGMKFVPPETQVKEEKVEQTEWSVFIDSFPPNVKINIIKAYREVTGAPLKESKDFVENCAGKPVKGGLPRDEAEKIKLKLEATGAKVTLK
jgi:large subunit ribosomal protein L7/L12